MTGETAQPIVEICFPFILPGENLYVLTVQSVTVTKYINTYIMGSL